MKIVLLILALCSAATIGYAQKKAVTSTGEEVLLYEDGTWKYANEEDAEETVITTNPKTFTKSTGATFLLQSSRAKMGVHVNSKKWSLEKQDDPSGREYMFTRKGKDAYAMLISERIEIPLDQFPQIALSNAREVAPDVKLESKEYRIVNGNKVLCLLMTGTMNGIKFSYFGYYFSNKSGTIQLVGFTSQNLFKEYQPEIEEFLNGLVTINK